MQGIVCDGVKVGPGLCLNNVCIILISLAVIFCKAADHVVLQRQGSGGLSACSCHIAAGHPHICAELLRAVVVQLCDDDARVFPCQLIVLILVIVILIFILVIIVFLIILHSRMVDQHGSCKSCLNNMHLHFFHFC